MESHCRGWGLCGGVLPAADERGPRSDRGSTVQGYIHAGDTRFTSPMELHFRLLARDEPSQSLELRGQRPVSWSDMIYAQLRQQIQGQLRPGEWGNGLR